MNEMKIRILSFVVVMIFILNACSGDAFKKKGTSTDGTQSDMVTYQSETGPIEVPKNPQRVLLLSGFTGNVLHLGVNVVGVDVWSKDNPTFEKELKDAEEVSDESIEKIIELEPDLIIGLNTIKNIDKLNKIAPTVTYTWGKLDYLEQHIEIGKLLNKEEEAKEWVADFTERAEATGKEIKEKIGEDATVTVIESYEKDLYVFGDNWARGTEILYQSMNLKMPEKVKEMALESGYYTLSAEVLPEYVGDYLFISKYSNADSFFQETASYKNMPAVKENHVFEMPGNGASFNDPITVEKQLSFFEKSFLGE